MTIVGVDDTESLMKELRGWQAGRKNLSQCSYTILELQTAYNKLEAESKGKLNEIAKEHTSKEKLLKA